MLKLNVVGSRCLIKKYEAANKTESGLILENTATNSAAPVKGTVVSAGDTSRFKEGDVLYFRRYSVDDLKMITEKGEEELTFVEDEDILAIEK